MKTPELMPLAQPRILRWNTLPEDKERRFLVPSKSRFDDSDVSDSDSSEDEKNSFRLDKSLIFGRWGNYVDGMAKQVLDTTSTSIYIMWT